MKNLTLEHFLELTNQTAYELITSKDRLTGLIRLSIAPCNNLQNRQDYVVVENQLRSLRTEHRREEATE